MIQSVVLNSPPTPPNNDETNRKRNKSNKTRCMTKLLIEIEIPLFVWQGIGDSEMWWFQLWLIVIIYDQKFINILIYISWAKNMAVIRWTRRTLVLHITENHFWYYLGVISKVLKVPKYETLFVLDSTPPPPIRMAGMWDPTMLECCQ